MESTTSVSLTASLQGILMKQAASILFGLYLVVSSVGCCCWKKSCLHRHHGCNSCHAPAPTPAPCDACQQGQGGIYGPPPTSAPVFPQTGAVPPAGSLPTAYGDPIIINGTQTASGDYIQPF